MLKFCKIFSQKSSFLLEIGHFRRISKRIMERVKGFLKSTKWIMERVKAFDCWGVGFKEFTKDYGKRKGKREKLWKRMPTLASLISTENVVQLIWSLIGLAACTISSQKRWAKFFYPYLLVKRRLCSRTSFSLRSAAPLNHRYAWFLFYFDSWSSLQDLLLWRISYRRQTLEVWRAVRSRRCR